MAALPTGHPDPTPRPHPLRCAECNAALGHDQRYCLNCGARRGSLPAYLAAVIGAIREQGSRVAAGGSVPLEPLGGEPTFDESSRLDAWLGAPRAAAVAVLGMLGFGVVVGSLVSPTAA